MRGSFKLLGVCIVSILLMLTSYSPVLAGDGTLTILATSDNHSQLKAYGAYSEATGKYASGGFLEVAERIIETKITAAAQGYGVLVLNAGDSTQGTFFEYAYKGVADFILNSQIYDATTLGNHEFDWTPDAVAGALQNVMAQSVTPLPIVCSNILDWGDSPLQAFNGSVIVPTLVKDVNGIQVGIFGVMTAGTAALGQPSPLVFSDLSTTEGIQQALGVAGSLQAQGVDLVVLLAHNGISYDMALAQYAAAFGVKLDVIISGHDHVPGASVLKIGNTHIIQVGAYNTYLGKLTLTVANKAVTNYSYELEGINAENGNIEGEPSPNVDPAGWATLVGTYNTFASPAYMAGAITLPYPTGWDEATSEETGTWGDFSGGNEQDARGITELWQTYAITGAYDQVYTTLYHSIPGLYTNPPGWSQVAATTQADIAVTAYSESNMGNLVSDAIFLRGALVDLGDENNEVLGLPGAPNDDVTDFAVEASGTLRSALPMDDNGLTLSDLYQVVPLGIGLKSFDLVNGQLPVDDQGEFKLAPGFDLMRFYMKGADLKIAVELGAASLELGDVFFLNWSGLTFEYDTSKDILQRVSNLKVAGQDVVDAGVYKGTTSTYVGTSFLVLGALLKPALNAGVLTQDQYDAISSMKIYMDRNATTEITDITTALASLYAGKEWLAFADKIMWPWWYGGLNGIIWKNSPITQQNLYGEPQGRMKDITNSSYRINLNVKGTRHYVPVVIGKLLGKKKGDLGYKPAFDLNHDGLINYQDLKIAAALVK